MCPYVSWPIIVEQSEVDAFGPINRDEAKRLLEPGFCILRRSPLIGSPYEWYLTVAQVTPGEFTNYRITSVNGALMFAVAVRNLTSLILIHFSYLSKLKIVIQLISQLISYLIKILNRLVARGGNLERYSSIKELIESCERQANELPFNICRRCTPHSVTGTRLQDWSHFFSFRNETTDHR